MGLLAVCNAYTMRVCLNLAVTQMVNNTKNEESHFDPDACPDESEIFINGTVTSKPVSTKKVLKGVLTKIYHSYILGSFNIGY